MSARLSLRTGEKKPTKPQMSGKSAALDPDFLRAQAELLKSQVISKKKASISKEKVGKEKFMKWIKFGIVLWSIRAGFVGVGFGVGGIAVMFPGLIRWFGFGSHSIVPSWTYEDTINKRLSAVMIRDRGAPFVVEGLPLPKEDSIISVLRGIDYGTTKAKVVHHRASTNSEAETDTASFTYMISKSAWSTKCTVDENSSGSNILSTVSPAEIANFPFARDEEAGTGFCASRDDGSCSQETSTKTLDYHWYLTHHLQPSQSDNAAVMELAPAFIEFLTSSSSKKDHNDNTDHYHDISLERAHMNIWLSSNGSTASPHYDTDDNFFLQLHGKKTFFIVEPSAHDLYKPYSYLHPKWRQARHHLTNEKNILDAFDELQDRRRSSALAKRKKMRTKLKRTNHQVTADAAAAASNSNNERSKDQSEEVYEGNSALYDLPQSYEFTLEAGDMLYLPAYFYHTVQTMSTDSASLNVWLPSAAMDASIQLSMCPLPYPLEETDSSANRSRIAKKRLLALARMAQTVYRDLVDTNNPASKKQRKITYGHGACPELKASMFRRHYVSDTGGNNGDSSFNSSCPHNFDANMGPLCDYNTEDANEENDMKEYVDAANEASECAVNILTPIKSKTSTAVGSCGDDIAVLQLFNYIDEVFSLIAVEIGNDSNKYNSPQAAASFVKDCL